MKKWIAGAALALAVFSITAVSTTTAQAQYRNDGRYDRNRDGRRDRNWRRQGDRDRRRDRDRDRRRWRNSRRNDHRNDGYYRRNDGYGTYGRNGGYNNAYQIELNRGYRQGLETGSSDAQRGQSYSPQRSRHYRNASSTAFRDGFVRGYDRGYRQYAGYGRYQSNNTGSGFGRILGFP